MLWLGRWWSIELSISRDYFESEDVLFEEILLDELFQILPKGPEVNDLVSLAAMVRAIFFYSGK